MATTGATQTYATELAGLWTGLTRALSDLDALAAHPERRLTDNDALETLARLRYMLHVASERSLGIAPPAGSERAHAELAYALGRARDATAAGATRLEEGGVAALKPVVHEGRGTLFAVRMARSRARSGEPALDPALPEPRSPLPGRPAALGSITAIVLGAGLFAGGTLLQRWPLWGAGLVALTVGCAVSAKRR